MRPFLFSSTMAAPCTVGRTRSSARGFLPSVTRDKDNVVELQVTAHRGGRAAQRQHTSVLEADPDAVAAVLDDHGR